MSSDNDGQAFSVTVIDQNGRVSRSIFRMTAEDAIGKIVGIAMGTRFSAFVTIYSASLPASRIDVTEQA